VRTEAKKRTHLYILVYIYEIAVSMQFWSIWNWEGGERKIMMKGSPHSRRPLHTRASRKRRRLHCGEDSVLSLPHIPNGFISPLLVGRRKTPLAKVGPHVVRASPSQQGKRRSKWKKEREIQLTDKVARRREKNKNLFQWKSPDGEGEKSTAQGKKTTERKASAGYLSQNHTVVS
jgi:hypothetical protein